MILKTFYKDIFDYYHELLFQCVQRWDGYENDFQWQTQMQLNIVGWPIVHPKLGGWEAKSHEIQQGGYPTVHCILKLK